MGAGVSTSRVNEFKEENPHLAKYMECQSKALGTGMQYSVFGVVSVFLGCYLINKKTKINPAMMIMAPIGAGIIVAMFVMRNETKKCQKMWLDLKEKSVESSESKIS